MMQEEKTISLKNFQGRLREAILRRRITQSELASRLSTRQSTIASWLEGSMPRDRALTELTIALRVSRGYLLDGREPFEMSEEEFALSKSRLAGGTLMESVMREDATPYRTPDSPEVLLRDEIMAALNGAQLSPDELRRKTLHQRIDDYLDVLKAKKP